MIRLDGTPKEFDDFWNNKIDVSFNEARQTIEELDLSDKTKKYLKDILEKDINILYGELDDIFDNQWKYFARSDDEESKGE